jgi:predicted lipase
MPSALKKLKRYKYEHYAILCQLAYQADIGTSLDTSIYHQIELVDKQRKSCARIVWQANKKEVIVVFRGSHSLRDWLLNFCFFQVEYQSDLHRGKVHWGIAQQLQQKCRNKQSRTAFLPLHQSLTELLTPMVQQGKKVSFIGHSTGGAMAVLYGDLFERKHPKKTKRVVTFGQPSVGGRSFAKQYNLAHKTYRICCDIDMITFLPPFPYWYVHVGKMLWLHEDVIYEHIPSWRRLLLSLKTWLLGPIANHYMNKYIRHKGLFDEH